MQIAAPNQFIHITDLEAAINYWRKTSPSPDGVRICAPLRALAEVYAVLIYMHHDQVAEQNMSAAAYEAWLQWYKSTPDTPCIAICSTSQGDAICKGCGRSFEEVQNWQAMAPVHKRGVWRRISLEATAWRFNRYAERANLGIRPEDDGKGGAAA